jgi:hypothetical protein
MKGKNGCSGQKPVLVDIYPIMDKQDKMMTKGILWTMMEM